MGYGCRPVASRYCLFIQGTHDVTCSDSSDVFRSLGAEGTPPPSAIALPEPHFVAQPSDPPWLVQVAQFHGHLGPSVVAGTRFGLAGLRAVWSTRLLRRRSHLRRTVRQAAAVMLSGRPSGWNWGDSRQAVAQLGAGRCDPGAGQEHPHRQDGRAASDAAIAGTAGLAERWRPRKRPRRRRITNTATHAQSPVELLARKIAAMSDAELVLVRVTAGP